MSLKRILTLLAVVWLGALVVAYAAVHLRLMLPVPPAVVALAVLRLAVDVIAVALVVTLGGALGNQIVPQLDSLTAEEAVAVQALLGLAAISIAVLAAGLVGLFLPTWLAWLILAALLGLLHRAALGWLRHMRDALRTIFAPSDDPLVRWLRRGTVFLLALAAVLALAPPAAWDALMYHLAGPHLYLDAGRIVSTVDNFRLGYPQLVEMLYAALMILARPQAAGLLHWAFGALSLMIVLGAARRIRPGAAAGWLAVGALLASESLWLLFGRAYNDLAAMAYATAAVGVLLGWRGNRREIVLTGVLAGCMMGTRYTAAGPALGIGLLALWLARRDGWRGALLTGGTLTLVALLAFSPWLIKNALVDGNPISPYVWGAPSYDSLDAAYEQRPGTGLNVGELFAAPLQATVFGVEGRLPFNNSSGPLLLGLLPFVFVGWRKRGAEELETLIGLLIFGGTACMLWLAGAAVTTRLMHIRYLYPAFPTLALAVGLGATSFGPSDAARRFRRLAGWLAAVALAVTVAIVSVLAVTQDPLPVELGLRSPDAYLLDRLGAFYAAMQQIDGLPDGAQVLMLWEPRGYYCLPRCITDDALDSWWRLRQQGIDPSQAVDRWREAGITHVLVFEAGARFLLDEEPNDPLTAADVAAFDTLRGGALQQVWQVPGIYTLYVLR